MALALVLIEPKGDWRLVVGPAFAMGPATLLGIRRVNDEESYQILGDP